MTNKRVMVIYGTRPEAVKVASLIHAIDDHPALESIVLSTGQHQDILEAVNNLFSLRPVKNLRVGGKGDTLNQMAGAMLAQIDEVLANHSPDAVVVQGDTTTVLMAALAAFNRQIPVVHLEAGLRSHNIHSPFPEEANRRLTTQIASLHLAPTDVSRDNLLREGVAPESVFVVGNTVIDALQEIVAQDIQWKNPVLADAVASGYRIITVTAHRRENWGEPMVNIAHAIKELSRKYADTIFVLPLHPNPTVRQAIVPVVESADNVKVVDPQEYDQFCHLMKVSYLMVSDSGGVQEEAPSLGVPVLVLRENTERPEGVKAGTARLIGTDRGRIVTEVSALLDDDGAYAAMAGAVNPYGDGRASQRSAAAIAHLLGVGERLEPFSEAAQ